MNHKWNYRPITQEQAEISRALAQELGISPVLGRLLVQRGITKAQDAKKFFRPQLPDLHDPFLMKDMDIAVERLNMAMGKKERILIYGDYDVDGITSTVLLRDYLKSCGVKCLRFVSTAGVPRSSSGHRSDIQA